MQRIPYIICLLYDILGSKHMIMLKIEVFQSPEAQLIPHIMFSFNDRIEAVDLGSDPIIFAVHPDQMGHCI